MGLQESAFATVAATVAASAELAASVVQASIPAHVTAAQNVMRKVGGTCAASPIATTTASPVGTWVRSASTRSSGSWTTPFDGMALGQGARGARERQTSLTRAEDGTLHPRHELAARGPAERNDDSK